jgi:hypothetical protein
MILVSSATTTRLLLSLLFILFDLWSQFSLEKGTLLGSYDGLCIQQSFKAI